MKKAIFLVITTLLMHQLALAQVKLWHKGGSMEKTKGVFCLLHWEKTEPLSEDSTKSIIGATLVGALIPFLITTGNYAVKKATTRNEKDYTSETTSLNTLPIPGNVLDTSRVYFNAQLYFYKKGSTFRDTAATYYFKAYQNKALLHIALDKAVVPYATVKVKRNYDLLITRIDLTLQALISEKEDNATTEKMIDLGTHTISLLYPGFTSTDYEVINQADYLIPNYSTENRGSFTIKELRLQLTINQVNPYGLTSSGLNDFLINNSDANEAFLNQLLNKN